MCIHTTLSPYIAQTFIKMMNQYIGKKSKKIIEILKYAHMKIVCINSNDGW